MQCFAIMLSDCAFMEYWWFFPEPGKKPDTVKYVFIQMRDYAVKKHKKT